MKLFKRQCQDKENHEKLIIQLQNNENQGILKIPHQNFENHENLIILR